MRRAGRQVQDVVDDEREQQRPGQLHRARGVARLLVGRDLIPSGPRRQARLQQHDPRHDVQHDRRQQHEAEGPEQGRLRPEQLGIRVERLAPLEHLEVAQHVHEDEARQDDPGQGHEDLEADRGSPESQETGARCRSGGRGRFCGDCAHGHSLVKWNREIRLGSKSSGLGGS
jgi:hypothetical protein